VVISVLEIMVVPGRDSPFNAAKPVLHAIATFTVIGNANFTQTGVTWVEVMGTGWSGFVGAARMYKGFVWSASASTTITVARADGGAFNSAGVAAEFTGTYLFLSAIGASSSGSSTSASTGSITPGVPPSLIVASMGTRGTWNTQTTIYSAATNGFSLIGQSNTTINLSNTDRSNAMLVKLVSDQSSTSAGATVPNNAWVGALYSLSQPQAGFLIQ
jgi:hypothetical protein